MWRGWSCSLPPALRPLLRAIRFSSMAGGRPGRLVGARFLLRRCPEPLSFLALASTSPVQHSALQYMRAITASELLELDRLIAPLTHEFQHITRACNATTIKLTVEITECISLRTGWLVFLPGIKFKFVLRIHPFVYQPVTDGLTTKFLNSCD